MNYLNNHYQLEKELEESLINDLIDNGYARVNIKNEEELEANLKKQLEIHNKRNYSNKEFERILNTIRGKNIFESAKTLRNKQVIDSDDNEKIFVEFFDLKQWCKNEFQVSNQITIEGNHTNRYDVTLLINGFPMVQIELKRRGGDFSEAFNQIKRYKKHSYSKLFNYIQFFVFSNGIDTKYFANNDGEFTFEQTFFWSDKENQKINNLKDIAIHFLEKCHVAKMIARYMVLDETNKKLLVLRPYQIYAVEALIKRCTETNNNGYIWHSTGSGKTLTSFMLSKLLQNEANVKKVIFLVDRRDLDHQTVEEFNRFQPDSVNTTEHTSRLMQFLDDSSKKLILTTIQKMSIACKKPENHFILNNLAQKTGKIVFVIDECHRSQFGEMHKEIQKIFPNAQYFGFTGTPRFKENPSNDGRTSADIFEQCLHHYSIKDAINDGNVLGFDVDYVKTINHNVDETDDTKIKSIDTDEVIMADERVNNVANDVLKRWEVKTCKGKYNALFAVKSIALLLKYYNKFKTLNHKLKIAAIFSLDSNSENGLQHQEELAKIINDYNGFFNTSYSVDNINKYFYDVSKKMKTQQIDLLLVVGMFLTGFDAKGLNTLFVDKHLKNHELMQAFSRTNRIHDRKKNYGCIVLYQTNAQSVSDAIKLFSGTENIDDVLMKDMDYYLQKFKEATHNLKQQFPDINKVDISHDEEQSKDFALAFRELLRTMNYLKNFLEFDQIDWQKEFDFTRQDYEDYRSKYYDIQKHKNTLSSTSVIKEFDFCLELLSNEKINVAYIINLLQNLANNDDKAANEKSIANLIKEIHYSNDPELRLKKDLIIDFMHKVMSNTNSELSIHDEFNKFQDQEKTQIISKFSNDHDFNIDIMYELFKNYQFSKQIDKQKIKDNLSENIIEQIKSDKNYSSRFKTQNFLAEQIVNFIKDTSEKYW